MKKLLIMIPYFFLLLVVLILSLKRKNYLRITLILTIFSMIRFYVGSDYGNYLNILNNNLTYKIEKMEFLNRVIINITYFIGINEVFFIFYSVLVSIFMFYGIKNFTKYRNEALVFFLLEPNLYLTTFGSVRQAVANSVCFYALSKLINNSKKEYFFFTGMAVLFHKSAVINFVIYFIYKLELYKKKLIYPISIFFLILMKKSFVMYFSEIFNYESYITKTSESGYKMAILFLIYSFILFFIKKRKISDSYEFLAYVSFLGTSMYYLLADVPAASRIGRYFYFPIIIVFAEYVCSFKTKKNRQIIKIIFYFSFLIIFIMFLVVSSNGINGGTFIPYRTFLSKIFIYK